ncbi:thermonuclease family protein [Mycoplasma sp. CSL7475-4]|uniref:thermonuclease family protein n=1 Tax=Mycoplasma sp. CSL7475-4 TaxID=2973942 RepID=UPI00216B1935|nr:thermonuclease family protein [Mycoplasma sp. CSL7475-4]MCS4537048.1 thermonuclease family protein [Mycoplasma sp. CSL7475-4]
MRFKKIIASFSLPLIATPIASVVSCAKELPLDKDHKTQWDSSIHLDPKNKRIKNFVFKAVVVDHSDGDTITVRALEKKPQARIEEGGTYKLRLAGIDTPEKNVSGNEADKIELFWAKKASKFAEDTLKDNQVVYVFATGHDSFNRTTGDVFFSYTNNKPDSLADVDKSYSVEITKAGWTLPFNANSGLGIKIKSYQTLEWYTFRMLGMALKFAYDNQKGFFAVEKGQPRKSIEEFANIYKLKPIGTNYINFWAYQKNARKEIDNVFNIDNDGKVYTPDDQYK